MGKLIHICLGITLTTVAFSQSASNFNTGPTAPATSVTPATKPETPAKPKAKEVAPVSTTPSRFVAGTDLDSFVESLTAVFSMQGRETDPFGQPQDPNAKPVVKATVAKSAPRQVQVQAVAFSEIVQKIIVTTIMPGEKRFLVGTRSVAQGEKIPLSFRNKQIRVEVMEVTSHQIVFKNLDSGETAARKLDILPVGMTPGQHGITAPGMVPDRPNAPLELETGEPSLENSQNR